LLNPKTSIETKLVVPKRNSCQNWSSSRSSTSHPYENWRLPSKSPNTLA